MAWAAAATAVGGVAASLLGKSGGGGPSPTPSPFGPITAFNNKVVGGGSASSAGDGGNSTATTGTPAWLYVVAVVAGLIAFFTFGLVVIKGKGRN